MFRDRLPQDQPEGARRIFEDRMSQLFDQLPALSGFSVQPDLTITELSLYTWPGVDTSLAVAEELGRFLEDLVDEQPDVIERLRGRTFARSFQ